MTLSEQITDALGSDDWLILHDGHHLITADELDDHRNARCHSLMTRFIPSSLWEALRDVIYDAHWKQLGDIEPSDVLDRLDEAGYKVEPRI